MNLLIDVGNTSASLAAFEDGRLCWRAPFSSQRLLKAKRDLAITSWAYCVSGTEDGLLPTWARGEVPVEALHITGETPAPLRNAYTTPRTLGADRWADAVGAWALCRGKNLLVVDAGTCVTFDLVTADGTYHGGNIAPGIAMRLKAMHEHTARLPLVEAYGAMPQMGTNTETALRAGAVRGVVAEVAGYYQLLSVQYPDLTVVLTGGSLRQIVQAAGKAIPFDPSAGVQGRLNLCGMPVVLDESLIFRGMDAMVRFLA